MRIERFKPSHLAALQLQPHQVYLSPLVNNPAYGAMLEQEGGFTALDDAGRVMAVAGVSSRWHGVGTAWALLSCDAGTNLRGIVRAMQGYLAAPDWHRVEASVDLGFAAGERMLKLLGFKFEGLARGYRPDGGDCTIWARVQR